MRSAKAGTDDGALPGRMRYRTPVALVFSAVLALPLPAYPLDDVEGWQTTRWGMTEEEVKGSVESLGLRLTPLPASQGRSLDAGAPFKTTIEINGSHYDVIFLFPDETRRLGRILIRTLDFSREHALAFHSSLLRTLTGTYGPPGETGSRGTTASLTKWIFKTTTVVLSMYTDTAAPGHHVTQVAVAYTATAASKETRDKLLALALLQALGEAGRGVR